MEVATESIANGRVRRIECNIQLFEQDNYLESRQ